MRKILILSVMSFIFRLSAAQDTSIVNYCPLNLGNVWVYNCTTLSLTCYCNKQIRIKVTGSTILNNKLYYLFQRTDRIISCVYCSCSGSILPFDTMRVDSASGNVYEYTPTIPCPTSPHEFPLDSLRARLNDTIRLCSDTSTIYIYKCYDTTPVNVFGTYRSKKGFARLGFESGWSHSYVKGIGLYSGGVAYVQYSEGLTLTGCVINGVVYGDTTFPVGINQISSEIPSSFALQQNYPNPFNPSTKIKFSIPANVKRETANVKLGVYDVLGKEVATLVNEQLKPGTYEVEWDGSNYPSGVYFYKIISGDFVETKKMVLVK